MQFLLLYQNELKRIGLNTLITVGIAIPLSFILGLTPLGSGMLAFFIGLIVGFVRSK